MNNLCCECKWLRIFYGDDGKPYKTLCTIQEDKGVFKPVMATDDACEAFVNVFEEE